jgi:hypothetical protein
LLPFAFSSAGQQTEEESMLRSSRSRWFIAFVAAAGAGALPAAGSADVGRDVQIAAAEFGLRRH